MYDLSIVIELKDSWEDSTTISFGERKKSRTPSIEENQLYL